MKRLFNLSVLFGEFIFYFLATIICVIIIWLLLIFFILNWLTKERDWDCGGECIGG